MKLKKNLAGITILCVIAFVFIVGDGIRIIQYPPRSSHVFRQSDCLAYTKTYYQYNTGLLSPACYNLIGEDGRVVSEFPILYYLSAMLCQLFGFKYWIIRGVTVLCYLSGLYYLFLCVRMWVKKLIPALFPVIILASSPFYFFYAVNFLPNVPAISVSFIGLYYLLRYHQASSNKHLIAATLCFLLAALLKPTDGGLILLAYMCAMLSSYGLKNREKRAFTPLICSSLIVVAGVVGWYFFVKNYNTTYGNQINLQGTYPIWDMNRAEIAYVFSERIMGLWRDCYQHPVLLLTLCGFFLVYVVKWRRIDPFLRSFTLFLILGSIGYTILWFKAYSDHDYYQLILTIPAVFVCIAAISYYDDSIIRRKGRNTFYTINLVLTGFMITSIYHNQYIQLDRYSDNNSNWGNPNVYEIEPYLREVGISKYDIVLSVPDATPNVSLVAFGNRGFTSDLFAGNRYNVEFSKKHGAAYMIVTNSNYIYDSNYVAYTSKLIGQYKDIYIFDIR